MKQADDIPVQQQSVYAKVHYSNSSNIFPLGFKVIYMQPPTWHYYKHNVSINDSKPTVKPGFQAKFSCLALNKSL